MAKKMVVGLLAIWLMIYVVTANISASVGVAGPRADNLCAEAIAKLLSCLPFLTAIAPTPTVSCCDAVGWVNQHAATTQDRRDLCKCLKSQASAYKVDPGRAKQLPDVCKVQVPVPIEPEIDCDKIHALMN